MKKWISYTDEPPEDLELVLLMTRKFKFYLAIYCRYEDTYKELHTKLLIEDPYKWHNFPEDEDE